MNRVGVPPWSPGYNAIVNWDHPWRIRIDAAEPNVSRFEALELGVASYEWVDADNDGVKDAGELGPAADPDVVRGAAVVPPKVLATLPSDYVDTAIDPITGVVPQDVFTAGNFIYEVSGNQEKLVTLKASFPSDDDVAYVKFMYSDSVAGTYMPMKGLLTGDKEVSGLFDMAGTERDPGVPGAAKEFGWNDGVNGDDDNDDDFDTEDREVYNAMSKFHSDGVDNDADGLVDKSDVDDNGVYTEMYYPARDADEDGIMDEDEYVVRVDKATRIASWTFDPVRLARVLKLIPGKAYSIKAIAYDLAGNRIEQDTRTAAAPIYLVFNVMGKGVQELAGIAEAKLYRDGQLQTGTISEGYEYVLEATTSGIVEAVTFQYSVDKRNWENIAPQDTIAPFRILWTPQVDTVNHLLDGKLTYRHGDKLYIRAVAGKFGNLGMYEVVSGLTINPQKFAPYDPPIAATVPESEQEEDIIIAIVDALAPVMVMIQAGDEIDYTYDGVDNDGDGLIDDADLNGEGDNQLADGALVPVAQNVILRARTDDDDASKAIFQAALVHPNGIRAEWADVSQTLDLTMLPDGSRVAVSTWNTSSLVPGNVSKRYDVRCVAEDAAGNRNPQAATIVHVIVGRGRFAAFITDPIDGASVSGLSKTIEAVVYGTWANVAAVAADITRVVFQYQGADGIWVNAESVVTPSSVVAGKYSVWEGAWDLRDLQQGAYNVRALVYDDQGYVNEGIEISVTITGVTLVRTKLSNFASTDTENPRVSMKIARDGTVPDIWIETKKDVVAEKVRMKLKASELAGTSEPENVRFEYKISGPGIDPKQDGDATTDPANLWKAIATDDGPAWEKGDWDISSTHELHKLKSATVVYIRARAQAKTSGDWDSYVDEGNYVPYVAFIFEEFDEPTATIARIERDGTSIGDLSVETRVSGGVLNVIPDATDNHAAGIAQVELFYKHRRKDSRDGDTLLWKSAGVDSDSPFAVVWDLGAAGISEGKYDLLIVATDQAGNRSSNPWDTRAHLESLRTGNIRVITIDRPSTDAGPTAYVEDPDEFSRSGRLTGEKNVLVSASSYTGGVKEIWLQYSDKGAGNWIEIDNDAGFTPPALSNVSDSFTRVVSGVTYGYYYWDKNGNKRYDAGEPVWLDEAGGNTGKYNNSKYTSEEDILMGSPKPPDEQSGKKFEDIDGEDAMKDLTGIQGVTRWADIDGVTGLSQRDFIWIDLDGDNLYDYSTSTGVAEPVVYCAVSIPWQKIMNLPPTNNTPFDLKTKARDLKDSAGKDGLWGAEYTGDVRVENIVFAVWKVNGREVLNRYIATSSGGKDYNNEYQRVTGDTVTVQLYVWPYRSSGVDVQLWYRYDDDLYPGAIDNNFNGFPDDADDDGGSNAKANLIANSKWDGIDNDFDGTIDEEQRDKDGDDDKWGEVNVWRKATTTVVAGPTEKSGDWDDASGTEDTDNSFTVTLEWDVSQFDGEFQYQFLPVIVDADGNGVEFNYSGLPFTRSDAQFPQSNQFYRPDKSAAAGGYFSHFLTDGAVSATGYEVITGYKIVVDHQGPYTYSQVTKDSADYGDGDDPVLKSFQILTDGSNDDMIVRTNDGIKDAPVGNDKRAGVGGDDYVDEQGEDNYRTYDLQAKIVSMVGGLNYSKTLIDQIGGVEFQYRTAGGSWNTLGYDYDVDYMSTFVYDSNIASPTYGKMLVDNTVERGQPNDQGYVGAMVQYSGDWVNKDGGASALTAPVTRAPRIMVTTWSLDNVDILDTAKFPLTNGTEYEFRIIATDLSDKYGNTGYSTMPDNTSKYDEYVVENRVGDDKAHATNDRNFMRDINWKVGAPFDQVTTGDVFRIPHKDIANLEAVRGPRSDGDRKDYNYWVNNIVPKAEIMRVGEKVFDWTAQAGIDPVAVAGEIDASVHQGDHVLIEAIVNPDPSGSGTWGTTADVAGDMANVRFYVRPYPTLAGTNPNYYKNKTSNLWTQVGMGDLTQSDAGANRYTIRVDTEKLVTDNPGVSDFEMMAVAVDNNGNEEPLLAASGEITIRVLDMEAPMILVGGLALDTEHYRKILENYETPLSLLGISAAILSPYVDVPFVDLEDLALNNFGNAVFPANPHLLAQDVTAPRRPLAKVSGELLHLYVTGAQYADVSNVTVSVINKSNVVVAQPNVAYTKDYWKVSTETTIGEHEVIAGTVSHTFVLSEQAALLYLPTWTDENGSNLPRFENVWLHYRSVGNPASGSGSGIIPPDPYFGDKKTMSLSAVPNSNGDRVWTATMDLELGQTYFYYFVADTVGDTWVIPDPKNLMVDEFIAPGALAGANYSLDVFVEMYKWLSGIDPITKLPAGGQGQYIIENNLFLNVPVVSKIWVPGTPDGDDNPYGADDELWTALIDLDDLPDGVYEIRVEATDKIGYKTMVSKTIVVDRTPPVIDPDADIRVAGKAKGEVPRIKDNDQVPLTAIIHDIPGSGINIVDTVSVLFEISRIGNDVDAVSTWKYAISPTGNPPGQLPGTTIPPEFEWLGKIAIDTWPDDGWTATWLTPRTDQNLEWYVRAVPFDDALNVQVGQGNQVRVIIDGTVPVAKVTKVALTRNGMTIEDDADSFELYPTDKDITLTAEMVANIDGDLDNDGVIEPEAGEDVNLGVNGVTFQYSLKKPDHPNGVDDDNDGQIDEADEAMVAPAQWITIPATQYSDAVRVPTVDGKWKATWQVDFSQLPAEVKDQYVLVRAVAEDEVGHNSDLKNLDEEPIISIMVLDYDTEPEAFIREVDGRNVLSPHLAVTKRIVGTGDPGAVDVEVEAKNVAVVTLEYRAVDRSPATTWTSIETVTAVAGKFIAKWVVATLDEGKYELRATAYDADGNMATEPDVVMVIVDHTQPEVTDVRMWCNTNENDKEIHPSSGSWSAVKVENYEDGEVFYPGSQIFRYAKNTTAGSAPSSFLNVKIEAKASSTDPTDRTVQAEKLVLQFFDKASAKWVTVEDDGDAIDKNGNPLTFKYSITAEPDRGRAAKMWTIFFENAVDATPDRAIVFDYDAGTYPALGTLIPQLRDGNDGSLDLRVLAKDYAGNENNLDRGIELTVDAYATTVVEVYSGSREYIGGTEPTIVAVGGDPVDLWAKIRDDGTGVAGVRFRIPASYYKDTTVYDATQFPVPPTTWDEIGSGELVEEHGGVSLFHLVWTTPLNMVKDKFTYYVTVKANDRAGNEATSNVTVALDPDDPGSIQVSGDSAQVAEVLVERDVTPPAPPEVRFLVTHAAGVTYVPHTDDGGVAPGVDARIFDEYSAPFYDANLKANGEPRWWDYRDGERPNPLDPSDPNFANSVPQPVRKIIDLADPDKYRVFDTFTDWARQGNQFIARDHLDNCVEIWVRTPELEYGVAGASGACPYDGGTWRQYERYRANNSSTPNELETYPGSGQYPDNDSRSPQYIPVKYGDLGHDPGIIRVYLEIARDPNQDGAWDDADGAKWIPMDNRKDGGYSDGNQRYRNPDHTDSNSWQKVKDYSAAQPMYLGEYRRFWDEYTYSWTDDQHRVNKRQEPLKLDDVVRVPLYSSESTGNIRGYAYYWVMGDDDIGDIVRSSSGQYGETVWNTRATKDDDDDDYMDANTAVDGWYIVRTWAEDFAGNGNPYKDADRRNFGYAMVYIQNNDDIPPLCNALSDWQFDDTGTGSGDRVVWEGWHKVRVYTKQNAKIEGYPWYFGGVGQISETEMTNRFCKFFSDVDFLAIEIQDPVSGEWVECGFSDSEPYQTEYMDNEAPTDRRSRWYGWVDSTWVEDGATRLRVVAWDNGGKLYQGYRDINEEHEDGAHIPLETGLHDERRNFQDRGDESDLDVEIDNPRAQVVVPVSGSIVDRGSVIAIQAIPVSLADPAGNGADVGRVKFYARRKSVSGQVYNGPWLQIDALDNDLDGLFGEDPFIDNDGDGVSDYDLDKDGKYGEDGIDAIDTNEPYRR